MIHVFDRLFLLPPSGSALEVPLVAGARLAPDEEVSVRGDGTEGVDARRFTLEAETANDAAAATIERWQRAGYAVRAFCVGLDGHAAWSEPVPVRIAQTGRAGRATWSVRMFSALREARVHRRSVVNLLSAPFLPAPSSTYNAVDPVALTLLQTGLDDGDGLVTWTAAVPCGPGLVCAASLVVDAAHTLTSGEATLRLSSLDAAGSAITNVTVALGGFGVISTATLTTPAGTHAVEWKLEVSATPTGGDLAVSTPTLRVQAPLSRTSVTTPVAY